MRTKFNRIVYWIPSGMWLIIMFVMSSVSIEPNRKRNILGMIVQTIKELFMKSSIHFINFIGNNIDKVYHSFEYLVFTLLLYYALRKTYRIKTIKCFLVIGIFIPIVAMIDEIHQRYTATRITSMGDFIADIIGMLIMFTAIMIFYGLRRKNEIQKS
ncbi:VanZ family protein [candidate division WOR-3 bacterium]|nr:VanZ family protein [candidate division WOR-3 bacterium]